MYGAHAHLPSTELSLLSRRRAQPHPTDPRWAIVSPSPRPNDPRVDPFSELASTFRGRLVSYLCKRGCRPEDAEELAQETLLRGWAALGSFRREVVPEAWLFAIAKNVLSNWHRSGRTKKRDGLVTPIDQLAELGILVDGSDGPLDVTLSEEAVRRVRSAVATLPPKRRRCVTLWLDGESYGDIAVLLRISPETVKAHMFHAREQLRRELGGIVREPKTPRFEETR
jgi:RNA polymerase sigma-70 factor, ECF subfamily